MPQLLHNWQENQPHWINSVDANIFPNITVSNLTGSTFMTNASIFAVMCPQYSNTIEELLNTGQEINIVIPELSEELLLVLEQILHTGCVVHPMPPKKLVGTFEHIIPPDVLDEFQIDLMEPAIEQRDEDSETASRKTNSIKVVGNMSHKNNILKSANDYLKSFTPKKNNFLMEQNLYQEAKEKNVMRRKFDDKVEEESLMPTMKMNPPPKVDLEISNMECQETEEFQIQLQLQVESTPEELQLLVESTPEDSAAVSTDFQIKNVKEPSPQVPQEVSNDTQTEHQTPRKDTNENADINIIRWRKKDEKEEQKLLKLAERRKSDRKRKLPGTLESEGYSYPSTASPNSWFWDVRIKCHICGKIFDVDYLLVHIRTHPGADVFPCPECPVKIPRYETKAIKLHLADHYRKEPKEPQCIACGILCPDRPSKSKLLAPYVSGVRAPSTKRKRLRKHLKLFGPGHNEYCVYPECPDTKFASFEERQKHVDDVHGGLMKLRCGHCMMLFQPFANLKRHIVEEHGIKELRWFRAEGTLPNSQTTRGGQCPFCGKLFVDLRLHSNMCKLGSNYHPYKCNDCGKGFGTGYARDNHVLSVHVPEAERPYPCDICGKRFGKRSGLANHKKLHENKREHVCSVCGFGFNDRGNMYQHEKRVHKIEHGKKNAGLS